MAQPTHSNADVDGVVSQTADLASALVPDLTEEIPPELLVTKTFVGAGGFGDVYRLEHPARGVLAIKQIKESGAAAVIERQRRVGTTRLRSTFHRLTPRLACPPGGGDLVRAGSSSRA